MSISSFDPIELERAAEQLRQERETFDQRKRQDSRWFALRLAMGYVAVVLLPAIIVISSYVLARSGQFSAAVVASASGALFVDVVGLIVAVWKIVLNPTSATKLEPVTARSKTP